MPDPGCPHWMDRFYRCRPGGHLSRSASLVQRSQDRLSLHGCICRVHPRPDILWPPLRLDEQDHGPTQQGKI